jgi:hypothetical protein
VGCNTCKAFWIFSTSPLMLSYISSTACNAMTLCVAVVCMSWCQTMQPTYPDLEVEHFPLSKKA